MQLIRFIFSKKFAIHIFIALVGCVGLFYLSTELLHGYSNHGQAVEVPDLKGLKVEELKLYLDGKPFGYIISDTNYTDNVSPGSIVDQNPKAGTMVKENRKLYLTVGAKENRLVSLPDVREASFEEAQNILKRNRLGVGKPIMESAPCNGCVIRMEMDGQVLKPGSQVMRGGKIILVIGSSGSGEMVDLPNLVGQKLLDIQNGDLSSMFSILEISFDSCATAQDSLSAIVVRQFPVYSPGEKLGISQPINIWMGCE